MPKKKKGGGSAPARHDRTKDAEDKRILVVDHSRCKPKTEAFEFLKRHAGKCPGRLMCIQVAGKKIEISEDLCAVCLTRAKQCPGDAVKIIKLPSNLDVDCTHRYGANMFKLHGLPIPRPGHVLGILGCNGTGKSTALNVLSGKMKPNLGMTDGMAPGWHDIITYYRGSDLQNYFTNLIEETTRCSVKPQLQPGMIARVATRKVRDILERRNEKDNLEEMIDRLELRHLMDRELQHLSGGELQRFTVCATVVTDAEAYLFDEPCSFLDVKQRLAAMDVIRGLVDPATHAHAVDGASAAGNTYVIVVEHDLTILDYCSDYVCCLYGEPGAYGVVTKRCHAAPGINQYLAGYFQAENMRFRKEELTFEVSVQDIQAGTALELAQAAKDPGAASDALAQQRSGVFPYPNMSRTLVSKRGGAESKFTLHVEAGTFREAEIIGLMGQNGCGKTTFMEMLAGVHSVPAAAGSGASKTTRSEGVSEGCGSSGSEETAAAVAAVGGTAPPLPPAGHERLSLKSYGVSYKRQHAGARFRKFSGSVRDFVEAHMQAGLQDRLFRLLVMKPLRIDALLDLPVRSLSGGELQRLAICMCLGKKARVYLIDEPSAGLDCEQRIVVAKVIKRWIVSQLGKTAFIIEHDMVMATSLYDRVVVYEGTPGVECTALAPQTPTDGFNAFLRQLDITFRRDAINSRPRINKKGSTLDREQKRSGVYYSLETVAT